MVAKLRGNGTYIYSTLNRYDPTSFADSQALLNFGKN